MAIEFRKSGMNLEGNFIANSKEGLAFNKLQAKLKLEGKPLAIVEADAREALKSIRIRKNLEK